MPDVAAMIELQRSVDDLAGEAHRLRQSLTRLIIVAALVFLGLVVAICAAVVVQMSNSQAIEQNNQRWCPTLSLLILHPGDPQPTSNRAMRVAQQTQILYDSYGCGALPPDPSLMDPSPTPGVSRG